MISYPVQITRKKIKNLYLRIQPDGSVSVSAPRRLSDKAIWEFIRSKEEWIETQRAKVLKRQTTMPLAQSLTYTTGETHYLWGKPHRLVVENTEGKSRVFVENTVPQPTIHLQVAYDEAKDTEAALKQRKYLLTEFYREQLKEAVPPLMSKYIGIVGKTPTEWRIKNMKTKWGTCNVQEKRIWLSLNLAKKDIRCLEYVIAHELTHLHEANHSKTFWMHMDCFYPEWREIRKLLNG